MSKFSMLFIMLLTCYLTPILSEHNPYLENRIEKKDKRYPSFDLVLNLLSQHQSKILVETGTARSGSLNFEGDGGSTVIFADWANHNEAVFYSVDIDPVAIKNAKEATAQFDVDLTLVCSDSIRFLKTFGQPIDFLYLDSYEYDFNDPLPSQRHHLKEIQSVYPFLHSESIVMIDDCDLPGGGKGKLVLQYLLARNWEIIFEGYQVILIPKINKIDLSLNEKKSPHKMGKMV